MRLFARVKMRSIRHVWVTVRTPLPVDQFDAELVEQPDLQPSDGIFRLTRRPKLALHDLAGALERRRPIVELQTGSNIGLALIASR